MLEIRLDDHLYLVGTACSIADLSNFAYTHVAADAGYDLGRYPAVSAWLDRVRSQARFVTTSSHTPTTPAPAPAARSMTHEWKGAGGFVSLAVVRSIVSGARQGWGCVCR